MISWMKHGRRTQEATAPQVLQQILWLSGPAGSGKTAIMGTIADECDEEGLLAAGFFFSSFAGHSDRSSKHFFVTTLVYQLAQHDRITGYSDEVSVALDRDPLIFKRDLQAQVDALILTPLRNVSGRSDRRGWPQLFLVDGLDECVGDEQSTQGTGRGKGEVHQEILSVLVRASDDPAFPFHIIIASRPERAIEGYFSSLPKGVIKRVFLDSKYSPEADMELYARAMLSQIGMECGLPENWSFRAGQAVGTEDVPRYWAKEASGQFVYVATVIRYVQSGPGTPYERLEHVLNWRQSDSSKPFSALDALYSGILRTSPDPILAVKWIGAVLKYVDYEEGAWYITTVQEASPGEAQHLLGPLSSLIRIVNEDGEPNFSFYHKSLSDFLEDSQRSGDLHLTEDEVNSFQASRYSAVLKNKGPLVPLPANRTLDAFMTEFFTYFTFPHVFPPAHNYPQDASEVEWWLAHQHVAIAAPEGVVQAFVLVHGKCCWYACRRSCKVWRKPILRFAKADGWRVPTVLETLRDRCKHIPWGSADPREVCLGELLGPPSYISRSRADRLRLLEQERTRGLRT
ncbi:hypothetical protein FA13DRAFT_60378 [Coprinellus micaceus]|uniref:NACHT domain-containing protein n=1 Tax=Coprinellus micaceus TaxID=71717 RepID=A0A4Y7U1T8_COPMI|nr:hypothetical protein FA13DRAFT_60378 [Coprinellus micaceus]